jgi:hypothetical protein
LRLEPPGSALVIRALLFGMLATVEFDNKLARVPHEIRDERPNRRLPAEVEAKRLQGP